MEKLNRIIRIANILEDVDYMVGRVSDHNKIMALILIDYCNETILKAAHFHILNNEADNIWVCWKNIDKELKNRSKRKTSGLSELPYKNEILNIIHKKRNFVQHSGESPRAEDLVRYLAYARLFIELVSREILGEDFSAISIASIIENTSYRFLIDKAIEYKDQNSRLAGAFITCALSYAEGSFRDQWTDVDENLGRRISHLCNNNDVFHNDLEKVFSDIGSRIETNTKIIEGIIRDGCNPPREVLQKLPSGFLTMDQGFSCSHQGYEITSDDINQAITFAVRFIHKLETIDLLPGLKLDIEKGIKIE